MEFGVRFFPDVWPHEKSGGAYFRDALALAEEEADGLGSLCRSWASTPL